MTHFDRLDAEMPLIYDKNGLPKLNFNLSKKKLLLLGFLFIALLVIPLTVYLVQQQQQTQSHANPNTTLAFIPASVTKSVGDTVKFDVDVSPGGNQVNFIKLAIKFDPTKLEANDQSFVLDPTSNLSIVQGPTVENDTISVVLSIQNDPTKVIQKDNTKIGSVTFNVIGEASTPTEVSFDATQIQIRSINSNNNDAFNENVFLNGPPADVTIQGAGSTTPTTAEPTVATTPTTEPTEAVTPNPTDEANATPSTNQAPVCESLAIAPSAVGDAPFDVTFTVIGNDEDGTIDKVSFNYGDDSNVEDVSTGGGIGTASVSLDQAHTYESSGTFTATAVLTDDGGASSDSSTCTQAVTVSAGGSASESATITPLAATGPSNKVVGLGAIGGVLFLIGALLFLAL